MKLQKIVRGQTMLMGLAGALLLANSAYAQQDMDPTFFDDTPGTPQAQQAAVVPGGQVVQATDVMTAARAPLATQDLEAAQWTPLDENGTIFLMVGIGSIVLLGMAEAIRGSRRRAFRARAVNDFPSGAMAN